MTKRLSLMLVVALAMLVAMTGVVMAIDTTTDDATLNIDANIKPYTLTISVSSDVSKWDLNRGENIKNGVTLDIVSDSEWAVTAQDAMIGDKYSGYMTEYTSDLFVKESYLYNPLEIQFPTYGTSWVNLISEKNVLSSTGTGSSIKTGNFPIELKENVLKTDKILPSQSAYKMSIVFNGVTV